MASWEMPQPWRFEGENLIMKYEEKNPRTTTWMFFYRKIVELNNVFSSMPRFIEGKWWEYDMDACGSGELKYLKS